MLRKLSYLAQIYITATILSSFAPVIVKQATATEAAEPRNTDVHSAPKVQRTPIFVLEQPYRGADNASKEFGLARSDHAAIALSVGQCYYKKIGDPIHWSPSTKAVLLFEFNENLMRSLPYSDDVPGNKPTAQELLVLNSFHAAAIFFSDRISRDRLEVRREFEDNRLRSRVYQFLILLFGACATIFVSIRSVMQGNTQTSALVGVLAIVFSAAGAAASSMSAFDGSQAVALRGQRTLSQLQQLHWRVASDVLTKPEFCKENTMSPADAIAMVGAWRSRLEAVLDNAVESIARPGDLSAGRASDVMPVDKSRQATAAVDR